MSQTWENYEEYGVDDATANRILDRIERHSQGRNISLKERLRGVRRRAPGRY